MARDYHLGSRANVARNSHINGKRPAASGWGQVRRASFRSLARARGYLGERLARLGGVARTSANEIPARAPPEMKRSRVLKQRSPIEGDGLTVERTSHQPFAGGNRTRALAASKLPRAAQAKLETQSHFHLSFLATGAGGRQDRQIGAPLRCGVVGGVGSLRGSGCLVGGSVGLQSKLEKI